MPQSNIFEAGAAEIPQLFGDYLENRARAGSCIVLTLSARTLGPAARDAVSKSLAALGYDAETCEFATLEARSQDEDAPERLDSQALFLLVEGLDPLRLIVADQQSLSLLETAYRTSLQPDSAARVFGRPCAAFAELDTLLQTEEGKQRAWALFKTLR